MIPFAVNIQGWCWQVNLLYKHALSESASRDAAELCWAVSQLQPVDGSE